MTMQMSTNPTTEWNARQTARVHSSESLVSHPYAAPSGNTYVGATTTVTSSETTPKADITIAFVSQGMVKAGVSGLAGIPVKCAESVADLIATVDFKGAAKSTLVVPGVDTRVILVGLGEVIDGVSPALHYISQNGLRTAVHAGVEASKAFKPASIAVVAPKLPVNAYDSVTVGFGDGVKLPKEDKSAPAKPNTPIGTPVDAVDAAEVAALVTRTAVLANHAFDKYLLEAEHIIKAMTIVTAPQTAAALAEAVSVAEGVMLARELCNDRADVAHPAYYEAQARALGEANSDVLTVRVLQHDELVAQGYNLITAVGQSSLHRARIVVMEYKNAEMPQPVALVGKTITFDTGGLNIKPTGFMEQMHEDNGGGAAVMGTMMTLCRTRPQKHVIGALAVAENAIGSLAFKPHAIIPSHIGSIQIGNTDAEGRLALADTLIHVQSTYNPSHLIDIATLTGACVVALGEYAAGVFSNSPKMASKIQAAGEPGYERIWPLPIMREHQAELKGDQADFNSTGRGRYGGSSTAASFIEKFVQPNVAWAHLDIAGAASASAKRDYLPKGASGFGVQTMFNYVK